MHIQVPPAMLYVVGALLLISGSWRAIHLGWQRRDRPVDEEAAGRTKGPRYHLTAGIVWVVMGLILVITTYVQSRR
jgi:uncharacterized membrane protein HdeD (DUF308 family)